MEGSPSLKNPVVINRQTKAWSPYGRKDRKHVLATMSQKAYYSSPKVDCKNLLWEIAIIKNMFTLWKKKCLLISHIILTMSLVHG